MWRKESKVSNMSKKADDVVNLVETANLDEPQRHPRAILETSPSTISFETANLPRSIIDDLDNIYTSRNHRRCIDISLLTLFSMTFAVISWVAYWLAYNRCQNVQPFQSNSFLCDLVIIFEVLTFSFLSVSPIFFILMIYSWIRYSCHNPFDPIRENFVGIKLEGIQWKQQLDYYYTKKKFRLFNCFRRKQRKELNDRDCGHIILSPHGIVLDELILISARKNILDSGILLLSTDKKILKLTFKNKCPKFWITNILIYLPDELSNRRVMEELMGLLKIQININAILPPC
jgi:hypothetical protein